ncbi:unnamed protein product [Bursaphelenchus xylophilus]|uniref:(pine wood nematode) hypothetical protein n=1 Tax=Bursaphelenchus xylophilus TaxID=6326 RepID=A0A1I7RXQ8_BURXY|nr:unnamed protein product [Bursaphelenchus xylophilus]CAG9126663.1 unnamed protein product [Bursaphelenchus xylophilus]
MAAFAMLYLLKGFVAGSQSFRLRVGKESKYWSTNQDQRLPRLRSWLLAPALSGSGSEPGARAGAGNFGCGSGSRAQSRSQASQRSEK